MLFCVADSFGDGLARLTGDEHKAGTTTAFHLQLNSVNPGRRVHRIKKFNVWIFRSARTLAIYEGTSEI